MGRQSTARGVGTAPRGAGFWALYRPYVGDDPGRMARWEIAQMAFLRSSGVAPRRHQGPTPDAPLGSMCGVDDLLAQPLRGCVVLLMGETEEMLPEWDAIYLRAMHQGGLADARVVRGGGVLGYLSGCQASPFGGVAEKDAGWRECAMSELLDCSIDAMARLWWQSKASEWGVREARDGLAPILKVAHQLMAEWAARGPGDTPPQARWHRLAEPAIGRLVDRLAGAMPARGQVLMPAGWVERVSDAMQGLAGVLGCARLAEIGWHTGRPLSELDAVWLGWRRSDANGFTT